MSLKMVSVLLFGKYYFFCGFHDTGYHALTEISRSNLLTAHLCRKLTLCGYAIVRRSQTGHWTMQIASGSGALRH